MAAAMPVWMGYQKSQVLYFVGNVYIELLVFDHYSAQISWFKYFYQLSEIQQLKLKIQTFNIIHIIFFSSS